MILIVTLIVVLLFTYFIELKVEMLSQRQKIEKFIMELIMMLCIIFVFNDYSNVNLLLALNGIFIFSYFANNSFYRLFKGMSKEHFQILKSMTRPDNSPNFYEFDNLYPSRVKDRNDEDEYEVIPPEESELPIELSDEGLLDKEYIPFVPPKREQKLVENKIKEIRNVAVPELKQKINDFVEDIPEIPKLVPNTIVNVFNEKQPSRFNNFIMSIQKKLFN